MPERQPAGPAAHPDTTTDQPDDAAQDTAAAAGPDTPVAPSGAPDPDRPATAETAPHEEPSASGDRRPADITDRLRPGDGRGPVAASVDAPTAALAPASGPVDPPTERIRIPAAGRTRWSWRRRALVTGGGVVAAAALLYGGDLALSAGSIPRGVTVDGVAIGGLSRVDAEQTLRREIGPRTSRPVPVTAGPAAVQLDPRAAGLAVDWDATVDRAAVVPLDPLTRVTSFFTTRETGVVSTADRTALSAALAQLPPTVDRPPVEGTVAFDGTTPRAVDPVPGQRLDVPAAADVLLAGWTAPGPIALPLAIVPPVTTPDQVRRALDAVATPAVSGPVTVTGEKNTAATLTPARIAAALSFRADPTGLVPELDVAALTDTLKPQLAASETPGRDATVDIQAGAPVVVPSVDGRGVDYAATLKALLPVLTGAGERRLAAVYAEQPAKLTTEAVTALKISGIIGEFTTRGFAADSGRNIERAAEQIDGIVVAPGETFSLNAVTNPRDAAHGYVEAGIIEDGHPARGIGGGVSQVATTLYNASYFAGMTNVEHKEHSFYISRYPAGREATVFDDVIDLKFRNDNPTAVMIRTVWTPSSITVRLLGTKRYDVTSTPGPRTDPTDPTTVTLPPGPACHPSTGASGFTITDTRTLTDVVTGQVRTETRTVRYKPSPIVVCAN